MRDQPAFTGLHQKLDDRHGYYHGTREVEIEGISELLESRSSLLRYHGTQFVNCIQGAEMRHTVAAKSADASAIEAAQRVENIDYAMFDDMTRGGALNPDRKATHQQTVYAYGLLHLEFAPDVRESLFGKKVHDVEELRKLLPKAGFKKNPFAIRCPDLKTVFYEPDLSAFCEIGEQKVADLLTAHEDNKDFREWLTSGTIPEGESEYTTNASVFYLETADFIYTVVQRSLSEGARDQMALEVRPNLVGHPWYFLIAANEGSEISIAEAHRPLIDAIYEPVQVLNILRTLVLSGALQTGRVTLQLVADKSRGAADFMDYLQKPSAQRAVLHTFSSQDAIQEAPPGFHYEAMPIPDQQWLNEAEKEARQEIQLMGFPAALSTGEPIQGDTTSGFHAAKQMEAASAYLEPALTSKAKAWRNIFQTAHDFIQAVNLPVEIPVQQKAQGRSKRIQEVRSVDPKDFKEHKLDVHFEAIPASTKMAIEEAAIRRHGAGLIDTQSLLEQLYDDPQDVQKRMDLERLREPVKQMALQDAFAVFQDSRGDLMEQAAAEAEVPLGPLENPAGGPAEPGGVRAERPPMGAFPNVGAPGVPPEQTPQGELVPPSVGGGMQGVAP